VLRMAWPAAWHSLPKNTHPSSQPWAFNSSQTSRQLPISLVSFYLGAKVSLWHSEEIQTSTKATILVIHKHPCAHTYMHSWDSVSSLCFEVLLRMLMLVIYWRRFCSLRNSLLCTWDCGTRAWGGLPWLRSVNVAFSFSVINLPLFVHAGESAAGFVLLHTKGAITCQHPKCPHHQIHLQAHLNFSSILSVSWASRLVCSFFRNMDFYLLQLKCFQYLTQTYMKCSL
jgi:hypothetical protein